MKKQLLCLLTLGLSTGALSTNAQAPNMRAVNAAISQNHMNMHQQMQMHGSMQAGLSMKRAALYNPEIAFKVVLKDSTVKQVYSRINFDDQNRSYLEVPTSKTKKNTTSSIPRIYPADTYSIEAIDPYGKSSSAGLPADSCWLFKVVEGKINGYTILPKPFDTKLTSDYFKFVQSQDGPLMKFDKQTVADLVSDNDRAKEKASYGNLYEAIVEYNKDRKKKK